MEKEEPQDPALASILQEFGLKVKYPEVSLEGFNPKPEDVADQIGKASDVLLLVEAKFEKKVIFCPRYLKAMLERLKASLDSPEEYGIDMDALCKMLRALQELKKGVGVNQKKIFDAEKKFVDAIPEKMEAFHDQASQPCSIDTYFSSLNKIIVKTCDLYILWKKEKDSFAQPSRERLLGPFDFCETCKDYCLVSFSDSPRLKSRGIFQRKLY